VLSGGCLCGSVRYVAGPPVYLPTFCHCESCRRASGSHMVGWITVELSSLRYDADRPAEFQSSAGVRRGHCARCGTTLTYYSEERAAEIDLTIASLDDPGSFPAADHIWMQDALSWDRPADGTPQFPTVRPLP
jgi:hypothetical protein